jgi:hypothetical protein
MSLKSTRLFVKRLGVPLLELTARNYYVNWFTFQIAITAITSLGQPDFVAPDAQTSNANTHDRIIALHPELVKEAREDLVESLYASMAADFKWPNKEEKEEVKGALDRLVKHLEMLAHEKQRRLAWEGKKERKKMMELVGGEDAGT